MGCSESKAEGTADDPRHSVLGQEAAEPEPYQPLTQEEVNARIQSCEQTLTHRLGDTGITLRYAYVSQRGYYPDDLYKNNQDAFRIEPSFGGDSSSFFAGVFDGHGTEGDVCSAFVRDTLESRLTDAMDEHRDDLERAHTQAFVGCNVEMHKQDFDDSMSGTTAITAYMKDRQLVIANIGDSRAIIGEKHGKRVMARSLSVDQTPYRADERARVQQAGAIVMSCDQLEGIEPYHENWGVNLGEELDNGGDPPRVWAPGKNFPGCAFTRSIGDNVAEAFGVNAEPELLRKELTPDDKFIVLASDGVWEFLTNQTVTDMILKFDDPLEACRAVVAEAYRLWLQYEVRTDDITMVLFFLDFDGECRTTAVGESLRSSDAQSARGSANCMAALQLLTSAPLLAPNRPVRRGVSKEKRAAMAIGTTAESDDDSAGFVPVMLPKTEAELGRIRSAVRANFLFQHLNEAQAKRIFDAMVRTDAAAGEVIIRQGSPGDNFYIVDSGEYAVTITPAEGAPPVEVMKYATSAGTNPCFGELAILHNKPRAATVTCVSAGSLWAIDRRSFRAVLIKSSSRQLRRTLRSVEILKSLSLEQLQRLEELLTEVTYAEGDYVVRQGELTDTFYVIVSGSVDVTKAGDAGGQVHISTMSDGYFGERALIEKAPRAANVVARGPLKCLCVGRDGFEEVLGPLQSIIDTDRRRREAGAQARLLQREAEGLAHVSRADFTLGALVGSNEAYELVLARHTATGIEYTLRGASKARAEATGMTGRLMAEGALLAEVVAPSPFVPLALSQWHDEVHLYTLFKPKLAGDLQQLIDAEGPLDEPTACFYAASLALAIRHLHEAHVACRHLSPEAVALDANGGVQLIDMRFAARLDDCAVAIDTCGAGLYLAPEQVAQLGHGIPVDYWQLGVLLYQMTTGSVPWIDPTEDADTVSETLLYQRIATHRQGAVETGAAGLSAELGDLINALLDPAPEHRLGCGAAGPAELTEHRWLASVDLEALSRGELSAPPMAKAWCAQASAAFARARTSSSLLGSVPPVGGASWSNGFGQSDV